MPISYVLINCDLGFEEKIMSELKSIDGVDEVRGTYGVYDIIAKVSSAESNSLREIITWKIRKISNIRSTLTLMVIEGQE